MSDKKGFELDVGGAKLRFNSMWLAVGVPIATTIIGGLWGGFELYSRYTSMEEKIQGYTAPDLSGYDKRILILEERIEFMEENEQIKLNSLRKSIDLVEKVEDNIQDDINKVEDRLKSVEKETNLTSRDVRSTVYELEKDVNDRMRDFDRTIVETKKELSAQIKEALENPLSN